MPRPPAFPPEEYAARLARARAAMRERGIDALLLTGPEDIYYLVGLDHLGYFAVAVLALPLEAEPFIVARANDQLPIAEQCPGLEQFNFPDSEEPAQALVRALRQRELASSRLAFEQNQMFCPPRLVEIARAELPDATWLDGSGIVERLRWVKSPAELAYTRQAAALSDLAARACLETAGVGVNEQAIVAEVYRQLTLAGSEYVGFPPIVRSTATLQHGHGTWSDYRLRRGDALFFELSGCVRRYHAPLGRLAWIGRAPAGAERAAEVTLEAMAAIEERLRPGTLSGEVFAAFDAALRRAYQRGSSRQHCGYLTGIGFPPSWVGGSVVQGIRPRGTLRLEEGMVLHVMSSTLDVTEPGYFVSDAMVVTASGPEVLTRSPRALAVR